MFDSDDTTTGSGQLLFVRWDDIVNAVDAGLAIDTTFDVRTNNTTGPGGPAGAASKPGPATPPLGSGIGGPSSLTSGGCGSGAGPMLPVAGALVVLAASPAAVVGAEPISLEPARQSLGPWSRVGHRGRTVPCAATTSGACAAVQRTWSPVLCSRI